MHTFAIIFLFLLNFAQAQEGVQVRATVDRNQMRPGDTFTYSVSVSSSGSLQMENPKLPDLSQFEVVNSWTGSETRGTFSNGQVETIRSQNFNYMLVATKEGQVTIGATEVKVGDTIYRTNPIQIEVSQNVPDQQNAIDPLQQRRGVDPLDNLEDDIFSQLLRRRFQPRGGTGGGRAQIQAVDPREAFYIQVEVDKTRVYQGEQVVVTWYLLSRAQIADIDTLQYPALVGFWKEDIEVATRLNFQPEIINGVSYQKARLASYALFPIKAGKAKIDSYEAKCRVIGFNNFGLPQESIITKKSEELEIEVMPLPEAGKNTDFAGGVGDFVVSAQVDAQKIKNNSPLTFRVRVEGRGNAKVVDLPKLNLPESYQVYDTKSESKFYTNGRSFKEFETLIIPRKEGEFKIPALNFQFFNPESKTYYSQSTNEINVTVERGDGEAIIPSTQLDQKQKKEAPLVLPALLLTADEVGLTPLMRLISIWIIVFLFSTIALGGFAYKTLALKSKKENLIRRIQNKMQDIYKLNGAGDWRNVAVETTNLIYRVISEIAGSTEAASDFDRLVEVSPPSFRRNLAPRFKTLMSRLEILAFAPENMIGSLNQPEELKKLIAEVEKVLSEAAEYDFQNNEE